jgi:hypothetical protein
MSAGFENARYRHRISQLFIAYAEHFEDGSFEGGRSSGDSAHD